MGGARPSCSASFLKANRCRSKPCPVCGRGSITARGPHYCSSPTHGRLLGELKVPGRGLPHFLHHLLHTSRVVWLKRLHTCLAGHRDWSDRLRSAVSEGCCAARLVGGSTALVLAVVGNLWGVLVSYLPYSGCHTASLPARERLVVMETSAPVPVSGCVTWMASCKTASGLSPLALMTSLP